MPARSLTIRGIPDATLRRLRARASANHRSLNGELLAILAAAAEGDTAQAAANAGRSGSAAVREATVRYAPSGGGAPPLGAPSLLDQVDRTVLADVCRRHHIRWLAVFGSHARGDAHATSDVDVVVEFEPGRTPGLGIVRVADALRPLFRGRPVDLVTRRGLTPRIRDRVLAEAEVLYAAG